MKILENGFSVSEGSDLGIGLRQNYARWSAEIGTATKIIYKDGLITIKPIPAYKSIEDSRLLYSRFNELLARDGVWTSERLDMLERYALKGVRGEETKNGISRVFSTLREFLGLPPRISTHGM